MKAVIFFLVLAATAGTALGQEKQRHDGKPHMKQEDRQRMREDMREVNRDRSAGRAERPRQMTPQEREKLRQDIRDANQQMRR